MTEHREWQLEEELAQTRPTLDWARRLGAFLKPYKSQLLFQGWGTLCKVPSPGVTSL